MAKKIVVGMSGGVDSSIALILLKNQGWKPVGVSLKLAHWNHKCNVLGENACCTEESLNIAKSVCEKLGVEYHIYDVGKDFEKKVIHYFKSELKKARTPNPCIKCNRFFKFANLLAWAKKHNIEYVASGHYARKGFNKKTKKFELLKPKDLNKDQTYGLSFLTQQQLSKIEFPLGNLKKQEVYKIAKQKGFKIFLKKKQSQDLCFVSSKSYKKYLEKKIGTKTGKIVEESGKVLGSHQGLHFYTIGQKKGLNLPGTYFVKSLDPKTNKVVVTVDRRSIARKEIILKPYNFISGEELKQKTRVKAKTRYRQELSSATIYPQKNSIKTVFDNPKENITPGQFCVFYKRNVCLGGGVID